MIECERHKILSTQVLKYLRNKTLILINSKMNVGILKAWKKFIQLTSKEGIALDSIVLVKNDLNDEE